MVTIIYYMEELTYSAITPHNYITMIMFGVIIGAWGKVEGGQSRWDVMIAGGGGESVICIKI